MRPFFRAILPRGERRDRKADHIQFHTESQDIRQPYVVRTISSCHMQGCCKTVMQNLQDCRMTKRYIIRFPHCSRAVIVRFSFVVVHFVAFLQQSCDKAYSYLAIVLRLSKDKCVAGKILHQSYEHLACLAAVLRQSYVSQKTHTNRKETEHVENLVSDMRQPCDLVCRRAVLRCSILHLEAAARNAEICETGFKVWPFCLNIWLITAKFSGVQKFRNFTVPSLLHKSYAVGIN